MKPFVEKGQLTLDGKFIKLTAKGKLFADGIAAELFVDNDLNQK
jgi:coproporphyrinogen III oxidase-like Fe-S oxidoreductase